MRFTRVLIPVLMPIAAALAALMSAPVQAQGAASFPSKPVKIIVPFGAGGPADVYARVLAQYLGETLKQPFVVENRPGGSGLLAIQMVKQAPADGYTILLASVSPMAVNSMRDDEPMLPITASPLCRPMPTAKGGRSRSGKRCRIQPANSAATSRRASAARTARRA